MIQAGRSGVNPVHIHVDAVLLRFPPGPMGSLRACACDLRIHSRLRDNQIELLVNLTLTPTTPVRLGNNNFAFASSHSYFSSCSVLADIPCPDRPLSELCFIPGIPSSRFPQVGIAPTDIDFQGDVLIACTTIYFPVTFRLCAPLSGARKFWLSVARSSLSPNNAAQTSQHYSNYCNNWVVDSQDLAFRYGRYIHEHLDARRINCHIVYLRRLLRLSCANSGWWANLY